MNLSELSNTECLLKSMCNDQMYLEWAQSIIQYILSASLTGQIFKEHKCILVK